MTFREAIDDAGVGGTIKVVKVANGSFQVYTYAVTERGVDVPNVPTWAALSDQWLVVWRAPRRVWLVTDFRTGQVLWAARTEEVAQRHRLPSDFVVEYVEVQR